MFNRPTLEGANCGGLPGVIVDKYFDCNSAREPLKAMVAKAICGRCIVREDCLEDALHGNGMDRGIVAGITAHALDRGRAWRRYELGYRDAVPNRPRPEWLTRPEAAETVEQMRVEEELGVER
jgi:hypothetical protein